MGIRRRVLAGILTAGSDPFLNLLKQVAGVTPLAYYPLAKNALDYSGHGYHGVDTDVVYDGQKATFNGISSVIDISALASVITTGEMTFFARAQNANASAAHVLVYVQFSFADGRLDIRGLATSGTAQCFYTMPAPATDYSVFGGVGGSLNRMTYALTATLTGDHVQYHENGAAVGAGQGSLQPWGGQPASPKMCLGSTDSGTPAAVWAGTMDHVAFINKALTAPQVAQLHAFFT